MQNDEANTNLLEAIKRDQAHVVRQLIREGVNVNARSNLGNTPLHIAAVYGRGEIVDILTDAGAALRAINTAGLTPMNLAANARHWHIADNILRAAVKQQEGHTGPVTKYRKHKGPPQVGG